MNRHDNSFSSNARARRLAIILGCALLGALGVQAQFFPGQAPGGFGGQGGRTTRSSSSTRQYPVNGTVGDAIMSIDPETRSLIVIADDDTSLYISQVVSNLDRPKPQVLIKVVFLEISHRNALDIGVEGAYHKNFGNSTTGIFANAFGISGLAYAATNQSLNPLGQPIQGFSPTPPGAGLYQVFAQDYQVTLKAIAQAGKAKVLSRPSIVARNNQPATINVGQSVPLVTNVRFDNFGNAINSYNYTDVGIILKVTPFITGDGLIEMVVSPETSELEADRSQWVPVSSGPSGTVSAPIINTRAADTVVVTPDGQTVIIGGLIQNSKAESESKIPLLGDIPYLGALFKHKTKTDAKTELLIFLTPHIIEAPSEMAALSTREQGKSSINKSFTEKELNEFLDRLPTKGINAAPDSNASTEGSGSKKPRN